MITTLRRYGPDAALAAVLTIALAMLAMFTSLQFHQRALALWVAAAFLLLGLARGSVTGALSAHGLLIGVGSLLPVLGLAAAGMLALSFETLLLAFALPLVAGVVGIAVRRGMLGRPARSLWLIGALGALVYFGMPWLLEQRNPPDWQARSTKAFRFQRPDGSPLERQSLLGSTVVLSFWATWCAPCELELPLLERARRRYQSDPSVRFIAVNDEQSPDANATRAAALRYLSGHNLHLELAFTDDANRQTLIGTAGLPTLLVLDAQGVVRLTLHGYEPSIDLDGPLDKAIATARDARTP